jgi:MFS family permease
MVLLMQARGLDVASIGLLWRSAGSSRPHQLPTGGLADILHRRAVLAASSLDRAAGSLLLGLSTSYAGLAVAMVLLGPALGSGPLGPGTWTRCVATTRREHPDQARAQAAGRRPGGRRDHRRRLPSVAPRCRLKYVGFVLALSSFLLSALMLMLHALAVTARRRELRGGRCVKREARVVFGTVVIGVRLAAGHPAHRRHLTYAALLGVLLAGVQLIAPGTFADLLGGESRGSAAYGLLVSAGFGASALGAMLSPSIARRFASVPSAAAADGAARRRAGHQSADPRRRRRGLWLLYLLIGVTG